MRGFLQNKSFKYVRDCIKNGAPDAAGKIADENALEPNESNQQEARQGDGGLKGNATEGGQRNLSRHITLAEA